QHPPRYGHGGVRRNHIEVVLLQRHAVGHLPYPHRRLFGKQLGQDAVVSRIQVLNEDEGHPGGGGQGSDELAKSLNPAGRGADGNDQESVLVWRRFAFLTLFGHSSLRLCRGLSFHLILLGKLIQRKGLGSFPASSSVSTTAKNWQGRRDSKP